MLSGTAAAPLCAYEYKHHSRVGKTAGSAWGIHSRGAAAIPSAELVQHCSRSRIREDLLAWQYIVCKLTGLGWDSSFRLPCMQTGFFSRMLQYGRSRPGAQHEQHEDEVSCRAKWLDCWSSGCQLLCMGRLCLASPSILAAGGCLKRWTLTTHHTPSPAESQSQHMEASAGRETLAHYGLDGLRRAILYDRKAMMHAHTVSGAYPLNHGGRQRTARLTQCVHKGLQQLPAVTSQLCRTAPAAACLPQSCTAPPTVNTPSCTLALKDRQLRIGAVQGRGIAGHCMLGRSCHALVSFCTRSLCSGMSVRMLWRAALI